MGTSPKRAGAKPRAVHVRDADLADALRDALAGSEVIVEVVDELEALQDFLSEAAANVSRDPVPGALTVPGVTVDRLRSFAEAAKAFFEAAPWRHLGDGDLIRIEKPKSGRGLDLLAVLGGAGQEFGLSFFSSTEKYDTVMRGGTVDDIAGDGGEWAVYFSPAWELPIVDLDLWERFALPPAGPRAYPCAMRLDIGREPQRPDPGRLAHLEGIMRVLAATTEAEMDNGRWSHRVHTAEGERTYTLTLPDLLDPSATAPYPDHRASERMTAEVERSLDSLAERFVRKSIDDVPSSAATPLQRAQHVIYEAFETRGRRQLHLIRQAIEQSPDCADAYLLLSERSSSPAEIRSLQEQAAAAGERALGPEALTNPDSSFWDDVTTRPYMRARTALAEFLLAGREFDAAIGHYRALLTLNPVDNQGLRYRLLAALIEANRNSEAEAVLAQYDEASAMWLYPGVLLALRAGDRKLARKRLRSAIKANRRVTAYLTGRRELPAEPPIYYGPGTDDEAVIYAFDALGDWEDTPGALEWLRVETRSTR